jgi:cytochrome c oxidase assembly protein subunit 15
MRMKQLRILRALAVVTSVGAYIMLLMGAIVSKTESGKGCGNSWPFCHGQLIPESMPISTLIELSHRVVSGIDGLLILILTVWSWIMFKDNMRVKTLGFMSLFFVVLQGGLGALTVVFEGEFAKKFALALHFGFSLISFASVILLTVTLFQLPQQSSVKGERPISKGMKIATWGLAAWTYVIVYTGALVRHADATMGCGYSFPGCGTTLLPDFTSLAGIHMLHRYGAYSMWLFSLLFLIVILKAFRDRQDYVRGGWMAFVLITLQALTGIITIKTGGQLVAALVHTTIISVYFSVISYLCMQGGWPWKRSLKDARLPANPMVN